MQITRTFDILYKNKLEGRNDNILFSKVNGEWVGFNIFEYEANARHFAIGLLCMGFTKGDKIASISNNRPEWNFVDMGIAMIGAIHVPIYPTISDDEHRFILEHCEAKMLIISDSSLYQKMKPIVDTLDQKIEMVSFEKMDGVKHWNDIALLGEDKQVHLIDAFEKQKRYVSTQDVASIIYTSGTTGQPKGVMLTHQNFTMNVYGIAKNYDMSSKDRVLSFLPLCHVFERAANYLFQLKGCSIYYAENIGTIGPNLKEIKATAFVSVPRIIEGIYDRLVSKGEDLKGLKKMIFFWAMNLGEHYPTDGKRHPWYSFKLKIAQKLVFKKWHDAFGGHMSFIISGGAALQPRLSRLFFAAGIPLMEGYGLTETSPVISANNIIHPNSMMIGTVGVIAPHVKVKIAEDGEVLTKGPCVMKGYYKNPELSADVIDSEGWFHTGDIGTLIDGRFLKITDRKKEMFKTTSGKYIAPQPIENLLKESVFIEQAFVIGENEKFASVLISPNFHHLHYWATTHHIHFRDNAELINHPKVVKQYQKEVNYVNKQIGLTEQLKRYRLVAESWTSATGELSPTLKLKRRILVEKYASVFKEIYGA